jgi:hypothetical protein
MTLLAGGRTRPFARHRFVDTAGRIHDNRSSPPTQGGHEMDDAPEDTAAEVAVDETDSLLQDLDPGDGVDSVTGGRTSVQDAHDKYANT